MRPRGVEGGRPILQGDQRGTGQNQPLPKPLISSQAAGQVRRALARPPHRTGPLTLPQQDVGARGSSRPLPTPPLWVGFPSEHTVSLAAPKSALQAAAKPDHLPIPLRQINEHEPAKEPFSVYQGLGHTNLQTKRGGKAPADREGGGWRPPSAHLSSIPGTAPLNERGCLGLRPRSLDLLCSVNLGCS